MPVAHNRVDGICVVMTGYIAWGPVLLPQGRTIVLEICIHWPFREIVISN